MCAYNVCAICVLVCVCVRNWVSVCMMSPERERERERERDPCVCVCERERECVCACVFVCVCSGSCRSRRTAARTPCLCSRRSARSSPSVNARPTYVSLGLPLSLSWSRDRVTYATPRRHTRTSMVASLEAVSVTAERLALSDQSELIIISFEGGSPLQIDRPSTSKCS